MTITTSEDAIKAAASVARDVADGTLPVADVERQAVAKLRELVGTVVGPADPVWALQVDIARQVLSLDGIPTTELAEWLAVARQRAGEPESEREPEAPDDLEPPQPESVAPGLTAEPVAELEPPAADLSEHAPPPPRRADSYDPLAHWPPSRTLR